jgi:hypothetical protein
MAEPGGRREGLQHWHNVYGWDDRLVAEAAAGDPVLRGLLDVERAIAPLDETALAIRWRITRLEPCHARCNDNVRDIVHMIGAMTPAAILGCGQPEPGLVDRLREIAAAVSAWVDGDDVGAGEWAGVLGARTAEKRWLAASLCKTLAEHFREYDGGQPLPVPLATDLGSEA